MNMRRFFAASIVSATLFWPASAAAQEPAVFGESLEVQLVVVDVFATDARGEPVIDLRREDFRVFEDGREVEIGYFSAFSAVGGVPPEASARKQPSARTGGRLVVFLDQLHVGAVGRKRVFDQLWKVLDRRLAPEDEVMVVSYDGNVDVALPMSRDRRALRRTLEDLGRPTARSLAAGLEADRVLQLLQTRHLDMSQGELGSDPCVDLGFIARTYAEQVYGGVTQAIAELRSFISSLAGFPGRKAVLHVSDGISLVAGLEAYSLAISLCDGSGGAQGLEKGVDTALFGAGKYTRWDPTRAWSELSQFDSTALWSRLAAEANTYQVSFYTLQATGIRPTRGSEVDAARTLQRTDFEGVRNDQDALFLLADETGGRAVLDTNDFAPAFSGMLDDLGVGYQLAYTPPTPGDGRQHSIRVEVSRPGVRVRHRKSYRGKGVHERVADGVLTALFHGGQENPLGARLEVVGGNEIDRRTAQVRVRLHLPLANLVLLPEGEIDRGLFSVYVTARDSRGFLMPMGQKSIPLRFPHTDLEAEPGRAFVYEVEIPLRGDEHRIAVALRDEIGGEVSYLVRGVKLGAGPPRGRTATARAGGGRGREPPPPFRR